MIQHIGIESVRICQRKVIRKSTIQGFCESNDLLLNYKTKRGVKLG